MPGHVRLLPTVSVYLWLDAQPAMSVAFTSNVKLPVTVGVPLIEAEEVKVSPAGRAPLETVNMYGGVPPAAPREALYGLFCVALGRVDGEIVIGGQAVPVATLSVMFQVVLQWTLSVTTMANWNVPLVVGVPLRIPPGVTLIPGGSEPLPSAKL